MPLAVTPPGVPVPCATAISRAVSTWVGWLVIAAALLIPASVFGQAMQDPVTFEQAWNVAQARPGDQRAVAVVVRLQDRWHINPDEARTAENLIPTSLTVKSSSPALEVGAVQFPAPAQVEVNYTGTPTKLSAYEHEAIFYLPVTVKPDAAAGEAELTLSLRYQACDDKMCLPPRTKTINLPLTIVPPGTAIPDAAAGDAAWFKGLDTAVFASMAGTAEAGASETVRFDLFGYDFSITPTGAGFALLLLVAAAGGALLNLTPCVLPVIPIKIMSLAHAAGTRGRCFGLGLSMSFGVVAFWLALGGAIVGISGFDAINELFQRVWFTIGVGVVIGVLAVAMTGLFTIPMPRAIYQWSPRQDTMVGSFGFGIMTAVLSTPCTAPFMGAAAAWATTQSTGITLGTFSAIGGGMALPYLVLSAMPTLVQRVPRTGPASELVKQVMGLLMLAAAAYFIGVGVSTLTVEPPDAPSDLYWWPVMFFIALAGGWLAYRGLTATKSAGARGVCAVVGGAAILAAGFGGVRLTDDGPIKWVPYTQARFERALDEGSVVVMDFTAEWCLNCKALEKTVLNTERVASLFDLPNVVPMKVDITSEANVEGKAKLDQTGRVAIPLLVVYAPDGREVFKSDFYTPEQVVAAVEAARGKGPAVTMR